VSLRVSPCASSRAWRRSKGNEKHLMQNKAVLLPITTLLTAHCAAATPLFVQARSWNAPR